MVSIALVLGGAVAFPVAANAAEGSDDAVVVSGTPDGDGDSGGAWGPRTEEGASRLAELERIAAGVADGGLRLAAVCPTASSTAAAAAACVPAIPSARTLSVKWQQQKTGYWCGPATVAMASGYFKNAKTQAAVATKIGTTTAGSDRLQVRNGLKWVSGVGYEAISAPSAQQLMVIFRANIGRSGNPFAVNTREEVGGRHYNKHPNRGIGHFVLATGYTNEGRTGKILDPAAGLKGGYEKSAKSFTSSVTDLAFFTAKRGVVA